MSHQKDAVRSGYWPLYRFQPEPTSDGQPFKLDSHAPTHPGARTSWPARPASPSCAAPTRSGRTGSAASLQADVDERWRYYEQLAGMHRSVPGLGDEADDGGAPEAAEAAADERGEEP